MKTIFLIAVNLMREIFRKKDIFVLIFMLIILMLYFANAAFFGLDNVYRFMNELGLGLVFLFAILIIVPFSAKLMIEEVKAKTIYPLLAKPVSRLHILLGKFLGSLFVAGIGFSMFFVIFAFISIYKQGLNSWLLYFQVYMAGIMMLSFLSAMAICLSVYFTFSTTVTLSYAIFFLMSWFGNSLRKPLYEIPFIGQIIYYILPHFEFFDLRHRLIHNWDILPFGVMISIIAYAIFYTISLLFLAFQGFKKRWL